MKGSDIVKQGENTPLPDGIILADKEEGETSYDVIRRFKKALNLKKIGHAGTLDPFATGLLIILVGQGTKLSPYIMSGRKKYSAKIEMGKATDTLDPTGKIVAERPVPAIERDDLYKILDEFTGEIDQIPPMYSAVSYKGERAYRLARRGVEVNLNKRKVNIYSIKIKEIEVPFITLEICCSGGTYIRSLASEIGLRAGTVAHLKELRRLSSGSFNVEDAICSGEVKSSAVEGLFEKSFIPIIDALPDMAKSRLGREASRDVRNGRMPEWEELRADATFPDLYEGSIKLMDDSSLVAIIEVSHLNENEKNWMKKIRVFN